MSTFPGLMAAIPVLAAAAVLAAVVAPDRVRSAVSGGLAALLGVAGAATGAAAMAGGAPGTLRIPVSLPLDVPLDALELSPSRLGGVFMLLVGAVVAIASLYGTGYAHGAAASRTGWSAFAVFALGMLLVPAARDAATFLLGWELMAVGSTILLLADHRERRQVVGATAWYGVMTHASFLLLLAGFAVLAAAAGGTGFDRIAAASIDRRSADVAFLLLVAGLATKAGLVPVHIWLPRAHPEAPSHVSAAMSAAMVKMGVYGALLVLLRLLPAPTGQWWGALLLLLGLVSALYGILQASVISDLKRLLAYSTTENVGLIFVAIGAHVLLRGAGQGPAANAALVAALLLTVSHAAFKTVLFLAAGSVLHGTGERDLDRLGGLAAAMPTTGGAFGVAALGAAALPVTSGFVAEWTLLQSLIHGSGEDDRLLAVLLPLTVAGVALTAGLALLTFVKAYGIAFLARPRSPAAAEAQEAGAPMRWAMLLGAAVVLLLGLLPGPVATALAGAAGATGATTVGTLGLSLPGLRALLDPAVVAILWLACLVPVAAVSLSSARAAERREVPIPWGCGGVRLSPRMQYTATSYAEPLVRVFDDALSPGRDVQVTHTEESEYLVARVRYQQRIPDLFAERVYQPLARAVLAMGVAARGIQNGSIHRYLGFSFTALVLVLVVVAR